MCLCLCFFESLVNNVCICVFVCCVVSGVEGVRVMCVVVVYVCISGCMGMSIQTIVCIYVVHIYKHVYMCV